MIHRIASAYGRWPHEVLALEPAELALACACVEQWDASRAQRLTQMQGRGVMVFPTIPVEP